MLYGDRLSFLMLINIVHFLFIYIKKICLIKIIYRVIHGGETF